MRPALKPGSTEVHEAIRQYHRWRPELPLLLSCLAVLLLLTNPDSAHAADEPTDSAAVNAYAMPPNVTAMEGPEQPVPFSHARHAGQLGLDCSTCHNGDASAQDSESDIELPATERCMTCHQAVATEHPGVDLLARHHASGEEVPWVRVYQVLTGVNWSHGPHTKAGLSCETCHGDVPALEVMSIQTPVTAMGTCTGCHQASGASSDCVTCHAWPTDATFETRLTDQ